MMKIYLLSHTPEPDRLVTAAAKICYSAATVGELLEQESKSLSARLLRELRHSGHHSPFEHASFTFGVDGLSRVTSHQLVRHRIASFSQQSQRYVKMNNESSAGMVIPPSVMCDMKAQELFTRHVKAPAKRTASLFRWAFQWKTQGLFCRMDGKPALF